MVQVGPSALQGEPFWNLSFSECIVSMSPRSSTYCQGVGQWMNEVRWKLIVERSETSCEGIHGTDCTDFSISFFFLSLPPFRFYSSSLFSHLVSLSSLTLVTSLSLNLVALSLLFPLSLAPDMKHPFPPHEIWRGPSWIVYRLAACMPMAAGGQAQVFRRAAVGEARVAGRTGPSKYAHKPVGSDYPGLQPIPFCRIQDSYTWIVMHVCVSYI